MEYLSGGDLQKLIETAAPIPASAFKILAAEMICGLQYLHSKGIIHR